MTRAEAEDASRLPTVGWFELFYDLVVVAAVTLTNDAYLENPSWLTARAAALGILALSWVWLLTTLINNIVPGQDLVRRILMLVQMAAIITAALAIANREDIDSQVALVAYAVSLLLVVLVIVSLRFVRHASAPPAVVRVGTIVPLVAAAAVCIVGAVAVPQHAAPTLVIALVVSMVPILGWQYRDWAGNDLIRLDHMRERLGLFIIIILGEGFAQLVSALHGLGSIPRAGLFALTFLVSFALWWIYFDGTFTERVDLGRVRWRLSLLGHLTLVFGIAGTLDILVLLTAGEESDFGPNVLRYFGGCIALVLLSFALLRYTARGRLQLPGWLQIGSAAAVIALGVALSRNGMTDLNLLISLCAIVVIGNGVAAAWYDHQGDARARLAVVLRGDSAD